jgi:hypothetical protein
MLILLWIRSYWAEDGVIWNAEHRVGMFSTHGQIRVSISSVTFAGGPLLQWHTTNDFMPDGIGWWFYQAGPRHMFVVFPCRLPVAVLGLLAAAPWIHRFRWRFSLRTLLVATTIVAVAIWAASR